MSSALPASVFKAYDIRGIVPSQLNADFAFKLGYALGAQAASAQVPAIVVGYDGRHSSPELAEALMQGIERAGINTIHIGLAPTPLVYYAAHKLNTLSAVAITGSHNPPEYNGFKMMVAGKTLYGPDIQALYQFMLTPTPTELPAGQRLEHAIQPTYIEEIQSTVTLARPMRIAVDCGNGAGGVVARQLFEALGCQADILFEQVDGNFPNHHPDPADPANLQDLIQHVKTHQLELGLALDGDADRLGVVTRNGEIIWPDRQLILYAQDILTRHPGQTIIFDVKCSRHVPLAIKAAGGVPLMWQTGHSLIKAKLAETQAPLAGEMSGHTFFKERWYGFDDGLYTAARLLEILSHYDDPSQILENLPKDHSTPELKLEMKEGEPHAFVERLQAEAVFPTALERITIDGIRAEYADGFGLARASNTTPIVVLRFEAENDVALARIQNEFKQAILSLRSDLPLPF